MGPTRSNGRKRLVSEINVTPLVDVMLVLLIIFMITAPMMTQGVDVDLPETTAKSLRQEEKPIVISITKEGESVSTKSLWFRVLWSRNCKKIMNCKQGSANLYLGRQERYLWSGCDSHGRNQNSRF